MSDPIKAKQVNPHPASSHRTPGEIARDETAPSGPNGSETELAPPDLKESDKARQAAVNRSAHETEK